MGDTVVSWAQKAKQNTRWLGGWVLHQVIRYLLAHLMFGEVGVESRVN